MTKSADSHPVALHDAEWRTSSYTASNGNCVEVAASSAAPVVAVRDTKDRSIPAAHVSAKAWSAFIGAAKTGMLDQSLGG
ncbi:hypothetical protein STBA_50340 [Streptomyces sp. MP131-18]|nr:hypothetical protein STBA_50340 [Streptomyces sp. MP131-18]